MNEKILLAIHAREDGESAWVQSQAMESGVMTQEEMLAERDALWRMKSYLKQAGELTRPCPVSDPVYIQGFRELFSKESQPSTVFLDLDQVMKIQAMLDGEMTVSQMAALNQTLESSSHLQSIYRELSGIRQLVAEAGEPSRICPESPDFYWSQIEKSLAPRIQVRQAALSGSGWKSWVSRIFGPVFLPAALGVIICVFIGHQLESNPIYTEVQVSSALIDTQSGVAVYFIDDPSFLNGALD